MRELFQGAFAGRRVFLTGHTGFKGSWLSLWLTEMGAEVTGYALEPPTSPCLFDEARVGARVRDLRGDVRDADRLAAALGEARPEFVFHLAAQPLVRLSYSQPAETFATNVMGTVNLLEAVRRAPSVRACVVVTSDKCYENREWEYAYRENDALGGHDPYSASKGATEIAVGAWRRSFFDTPGAAAVASARAGNVMGGDWAQDRLLPDCARALARGEAVPLRNPASVRPWQFVLEPLSGYLRLAARLAEERASFSGAWNFGPLPGDPLTVAEVAREAARLWGGGKVAVDAPAAPGSSSPHPHEAAFLKLDCARAATLLGWQPVTGIREALSEMVGWYHNRHLPKEEIAAFTLGQLRAYVEKAQARGAAWAAGIAETAR